MMRGLKPAHFTTAPPRPEVFYLKKSKEFDPETPAATSHGVHPILSRAKPPIHSQLSPPCEGGENGGEGNPSLT